MNNLDIRNALKRSAADSLVFVAAFATACGLTVQARSSGIETQVLLDWGLLFVATRIAVNFAFGVYRRPWRYVALIDAFAIGRSLAAASGLLLLTWGLLLRSGLAGAVPAIRLTFFAMEFILSLVGSVGVRSLWKTAFEFRIERQPAGLAGRRRLILYGAGRAGMLLLKELKNHPNLDVVGFADDDPAKLGSLILGKRVLCNRASLGQTVQGARVDEIIISIATASQNELVDILQKCREVPVSAKIIPSLRELLECGTRIGHVRDVSAEDILGRDKVDLGEFDHVVRPTYQGKTILVTGAGGSIGSELVAQLLRLDPALIIALDKDETAVYELEQDMLVRCHQSRLVPVVADIRHATSLEAVFAKYSPQIVFHAAAHKHVPLMEKNPPEAVLNNIIGLQTLLRACKTEALERFLFISSDKAVNSTSIMGATKRTGELLVHDFGTANGTRAACVRFGNVLNSRGSVVPLFQKQISRGGPVTITHPEMLRYFMTIAEAVQLVVCAGTLADKGDVFILEMGSPRKILDLARQMISLSGLDAGGIDLVVTGLRPGEKMSEELLGPCERAEATQFKKVSRVVADRASECEKLPFLIHGLEHAALQNDSEAIAHLLIRAGLLQVISADQHVVASAVGR
jgi:FlaA1/EpsC-like NDP-sugar epimerase